ncbi:MAG TPA: peptidylprolyl isomerase [Burkholderiaceae bacterium]|nr:peptidylprolyl isomerase [Burkholderiaceae bacterium]
MQIAPNTVVRLRYRITDPQGELLDEGAEPIEYLHGHGEFFDKLEEELAGHEAGYEGLFHLEPEDAFGEYDADLLRVIEREALPADIQPGLQFEGIPDGTDEDAERIFVVTDVTDEAVVLDGNHPLAGRALRIWLRVESVRAATEDELASGTSYGVPDITVLDTPPGKPLH